MHSDRITLNEVCNDGQTIHLYYNATVGLWTVFGLSAYHLTTLTASTASTAVASYSDDMQMSVVLVSYEQLQPLLRACHQSLNDASRQSQTTMSYTLIGPFLTAATTSGPHN